MGRALTQDIREADQILSSAIDGLEGAPQAVVVLGAGPILRRERGGRGEGLTTAAGIWMTAAIGMAAGMGQEMVALVTTLVALVVFAVLPRLEKSSVLAGEPGEGN